MGVKVFNARINGPSRFELKMSIFVYRSLLLSTVVVLALAETMAVEIRARIKRSLYMAKVNFEFLLYFRFLFQSVAVAVCRTTLIDDISTRS